MHPKPGEIDFLEVTWLVSSSAEIRTQDGRIPDLKLLTPSSPASLFHLSGTVSFTHFSPPLALFVSGLALFSSRLFPHGRRGGPSSSGLAGFLASLVLRRMQGIIRALGGLCSKLPAQCSPTVLFSA